MGNNMKQNIIILLIFATTNIYSQTSEIIWQDMTCEYESKFDSTKVSREQINSCLRLAIWYEFELINTPFVFQPSDIPKLDSNKLHNEYREKIIELENLNLPSSFFWQDFKSKTIEKLNLYYNLTIIKYRSYYDSKSLFAFQYSDECIEQHKLALNSDSVALLNDWKLVRQIMSERNSNPEKIMREYKQMLNSDLKFIYAKIDILNFGWWNCAIKYINRVEDIYNNKKIRKELDSLFVSTKIIECDEP